MGIRIRKVLGYGITTLGHDEDGNICDERINEKWAENPFEPEGKTIGEYFRFAKAEHQRRKRPGDIHIYPDVTFRVKKPDLSDFVIWDQEMGIRRQETRGV